MAHVLDLCCHGAEIVINLKLRALQYFLILLAHDEVGRVRAIGILYHFDELESIINPFDVSAFALDLAPFKHLLHPERICIIMLVLMIGVVAATRGLLVLAAGVLPLALVLFRVFPHLVLDALNQELGLGVPILNCNL